jgi:hypothetical protein
MYMKAQLLKKMSPNQLSSIHLPDELYRIIIGSRPPHPIALMIKEINYKRFFVYDEMPFFVYDEMPFFVYYFRLLETRRYLKRFYNVYI